MREDQLDPKCSQKRAQMQQEHLPQTQTPIMPLCSSNHRRAAGETMVIYTRPPGGRNVSPYRTYCGVTSQGKEHLKTLHENRSRLGVFPVFPERRQRKKARP